MIGHTFLGRYQAVRLLGEGGMGKVYLARQLDLGRQVVVKVMHEHVAQDPKFRERFHRETKIMAHFQHPYAVTLYDAKLDDVGGGCIVMEYIKGVTLDNLLETNGRLSPARAGRLLGQLCEVLQAAHGEGIVHRDLKPSNLMVVDPNTPYEKIKVMDFGLATLLDRVSLKKLTNTQAEFAVGTPGYMCPEQVRGEDMDHRGDLYSVGVILYEVLSGQRPYAGRCSMDVMLAHATEEAPMFAEFGAQDFVSPALEAVVHLSMSKNPAERPQNARELAEMYERALFDNEFPRGTEPVCDPEPQSDAEAFPQIEIDDPNALVHHLEAWMPEKIAAYKLKGFVEDLGGEVLESVPGRIRVRLTMARGTSSQSALSWIGIGRKQLPSIELELHLQQREAQRKSVLYITVIVRSIPATAIQDPEWRRKCTQVYCELRGYLMGKSDAVAEVARS